MIREYYTDRTLLVTGGTGFVGQALIAKILRELGDEVRRVYALIRPRRRGDGHEVSPSARLEEIFRSALYQSLRDADPARWEALRAKVVPVAIDERRSDLGLSPDDRRRLVDEVDTIFNSAATVVFDEPLDVSVQANLGGPLSLLELATAAARRVDFVHVSTAYVNGQRTGTIPDAPLPTDRDMRQVIDARGAGFDPEAEVEDCRAFCQVVYDEAATDAFTRQLKREIVERSRRTGGRKLTRSRLEQLVEDRRTKWIQRRLVDEGMRRAKARGWNDVYTYTKAMGEQLLMLHRGDVPLVVVRPSIIESSLADPEPGWITGLKVMDPLVAAYGRGLMPDFPARPEIVIDLIPVDIVVNATIAAATQARTEAVEVFHVATGSDNPVRLGELFDSVRDHYRRQPMLDRDGAVPKLHEWKYPSLRTFRWIFHLKYLYPIRLRERLLALPGRAKSPRTRRLLSTAKIRLQRVLYYVSIYHPYTHLDCRFETGRTRALYEALPAAERLTFDMDVTRIDWPRYVADIHLPGLRRHVLRDATAPEAVLPEAPEEPTAEEERLRAEGEIPTLPDLVRWACARRDEAVAFEIRRENDWQQITYAQFLAGVEARAAHWQGLGLGPGQRLILAGANGPEWVLSYMAASFLGLAVVPVDPETPATELARLAELVDAQALVAGTALLERIAEAVVVCRIDLATGAEAGGPPPAAGVSFEGPEITPEMEASIIFTSGTRVEPRGVVLSHANFIADLLALAEVQRVCESDRILSLLPLHHGLEFTGALLTSLWGGASLTYVEGPINSRRLLETIRERGITAICAVPRILKILVDRVQRLDGQSASDPGPNTAVLRQLRLIVSGGAPLDVSLFDAYRKLGLTVYEGYGLTETAPIVTVNPPNGARRGSVGVPLPGVEVRIETDEAREPGAAGEILVRGPMVTSGYLGRPDLTAQILRDGWLHTGDVGHLDADGYLYITGRRRDLIVTGGGKNVYPDEVEDIYAELPHTAELAVLGLRSARTLGEEVHGVAVLDHDARAGDPEAAAEEIRKCVWALSRDLPTYQRIARLHVRRRPLPRLDDGRIDREALGVDIVGSGQDRAEVDAADSLAPWERQVYERVSELSGLALSEIVAHADAPLDTLIDSLMVAELAAFLDDAGATRAPIDRRRTTLRQLLDDAGAALRPTATPGPGYWQTVLAPARTAAVTSRSLLGAVAGRSLRGLMGVHVAGVEHLPDGSFLLAANQPEAASAPSARAAAVAFAALRPVLDGLCLVAERDEVLGDGWGSRLYRQCADVVILSRYPRLEDGLRAAVECIGPRRPLLLFPVGASRSSAPGTYRPGIGLLAMELDLPVIPVRLDVSPRHGRPRVCVGAAVEPQQFREGCPRLTSYEVYREVAEAVRGRIADLGQTALTTQPE